MAGVGGAYCTVKSLGEDMGEAVADDKVLPLLPPALLVALDARVLAPLRVTRLVSDEAARDAGWGTAATPAAAAAAAAAVDAEFDGREGSGAEVLDES